jgi:hypothetical protein
MEIIIFVYVLTTFNLGLNLILFMFKLISI